MATHTLTIENWLPMTLNEFMRLHFMKRGKALSLAAKVVWCHARLAEVPPATGPRRVTLTFRAPGGRGAKVGDPDSRLKVLLDAMVRAGLLVDDDDRFCELMPRVRERGAVRTLILLEDLSDA